MQELETWYNIYRRTVRYKGITRPELMLNKKMMWKVSHVKQKKYFRSQLGCQGVTDYKTRARYGASLAISSATRNFAVDWFVPKPQ